MQVNTMYVLCILRYEFTINNYVSCDEGRHMVRFQYFRNSTLKALYFMSLSVFWSVIRVI